MRIHVLTLFPAMVRGPLDESVIGKARQRGLVQVDVVNPRDFTHDKHKTCDDVAYGGGPGMVMKPEPLFEAVESVRTPESRLLLMAPGGRLFNQELAAELSGERHLVIICGHYEGIDDRVRQGLRPTEISIGRYVLSNGVLPALVIIDAVTRLLPGVVGNEQSVSEDTFTRGGLKFPQYTRPPVFRGMEVPEVLLSGDHAKIARWREEQARLREDCLREEERP